jgi:hypothetical protein
MNAARDAARSPRPEPSVVADGGKYRVGDTPRTIVAADLNGNGFLDLATANSPNGTVSVLLNRGNGTFDLPQTYRVRILAPHSIAVADFNSDGKPDLIISDIWGRRSILLGKGDGTFSAD